MSDNKRTAAEIEADLEEKRSAMTADIDELTRRLNPKTQIDNAKQSLERAAGGFIAQARTVAGDVTKQARTFAEDASAQARSFAGGVNVKARGVANDASKGDPEAIGILAGLATAAVGSVVLLATRRRHRRR
ncbi:MAG TPA: DUF3618 domain-containing protein [Actinomycetaceae bacterium]|nr:DUF3618 domain-containing protein [Actinomycetaceae bacterium]